VRSGAGRAGLALALAALCACATYDGTGPRAGAPSPPDPDVSIPEGTDVAGVVHVVRPGQNAYRIAKAYGLDPAELLRTNGIDDPRTLAVGQELFVPGATRVLDVEPAPGFTGALDPAPAAPAPAAPRVDPAAVRTAPPEALFAWPLRGVLYGRYGKRGGRNHDGIDIAAPLGTPVTAAADGEVVFVGVQSGYGKVVILRHDGGLVTVYAHNAQILVREGARVRQGEPVAKVGQTGRTTGPHLHFEVRQGVKPRDPLLYLR
jgi:murein DD-endopeptidase MepM/ murein hydrolase activator NlpD